MGKNPPSVDGSRGLIVTTGSFAGFEGNISQSAYSCSSAAIHSMTLPMSRDLAQQGIRVNCIAPGKSPLIQ